MMPKPIPIIFRLNSVHFERASSATLVWKLTNKSICVLSAGNNESLHSFLFNNLFVLCDQFSSASAYMSAICNKSSFENPMTDEAEYTSIYLFT